MSGDYKQALDTNRRWQAFINEFTERELAMLTHEELLERLRNHATIWSCLRLEYVDAALAEWHELEADRIAHEEDAR